MISSADEFVALRTSDDPEEYSRAAHDAAPDNVWFDVIAQFPDMRVWVAHNKTVPVSLLEVLADDPDDKVRFTVASKRKAPGTLLEKLSRDPNPTVRQRVAYNAKTPEYILELLAKDSETFVAENAQRRLSARA